MECCQCVDFAHCLREDIRLAISRKARSNGYRDPRQIRRNNVAPQGLALRTGEPLVVRVVAGRRCACKERRNDHVYERLEAPLGCPVGIGTNEGSGNRPDLGVAAAFGQPNPVGRSSEKGKKGLPSVGFAPESKGTEGGKVYQVPANHAQVPS